jgi:hypothetical protein
MPAAPKVLLRSCCVSLAVSHSISLSPKAVCGFAEQRPGAQACQWRKLSEELMLLIFRYMSAEDLGRCAQVCRLWHRLV